MSSAAARILDANANRAREAMRVMEDAARFALNDAPLSAELKTARHELRSILEALPPGWLHANRDTPGDVGTAITAAGETHRANLHEVVVAAGKRLTESLRVMEEICKTLDSSIASRLESLRYRAYTVEAVLNGRMGTGRARQWRLCVLLTKALCVNPWRDVLQAAVDNGADCIQVREKSLADGELVEHVQQVLTVARGAGASVVVNDRADIALAAGADGVHLGTGDLDIAHVRQMCGRTLLIGASTHNLDEAQHAVQAGADYCGVGAMFSSSLKPERAPSGIAYLKDFVATHNKPHLAIGGITPKNIDHLLAAGARGVAVSTCVCGAEDPGAVVRQLVQAFGRGVCTDSEHRLCADPAH